ncbi:unnamed protein product [Lupinus luteus]|uniref:Uncharacterized protein n=1 Tax=Lupinus luteus TaxID=3873 RepID=A0AAV1WXM5_LUPLU
MALLLLFLLMTSFTVIAEELYTLPSTSTLHPLTHCPPRPPHHHHRHHRHHHHPPPFAPVHSDQAPPAKHPTLTLVKTPSPPSPILHPIAITNLAVQGVVYVKPCKYAGVDTLLGDTPLLGTPFVTQKQHLYL